MLPGTEYPLRDVDFPIEPSIVEDPSAPDPGGPVAPVGVEVGYPVFGTLEADLVGQLFGVPAPVVLTGVL